MAGAPTNHAPYRLITDVDFGEGVRVFAFVNLYGCQIGDRSTVGPYVEIQRGAVIGADCKIQSHSFVCDGVRICDRVFVGHGVMFTNDKAPRVLNAAGQPQTGDDWTLQPVVVEEAAAIGSGAVVTGVPAREHRR